MPAIRCLAFVVACVNFLGIALADTAVDVPRTLSRSKRYLVFPEGSNVQLVWCLTVGALGEEEAAVLGMTAALAWELPSKAEPKLSELLHRSSRSVVFPKIEALLQSLPEEGRFERSEDQAYEDAYRSRSNCGQLYPSCRHSIYELEF
ncbi:uncharacterized protein LOC108623016 [Ceratina calcarata]|uniref:Uncharacterized protein LOC108623016 n=1 Tax=Ceratina calcarata TaxID=156304 RepID=A0AAJ7RZ75_9HYME|nr:uncharacterized protein LOC108623016 [Ceratina calcarata]